MQIYKNFTYYSKYSTIKEKLEVKELEIRSWKLAHSECSEYSECSDKKGGAELFYGLYGVALVAEEGD